MSALDTSRYRSEREKTPNFRGNVLFLKTLNVRGQRGPNGTKACIENENVGTVHQARHLDKLCPTGAMYLHEYECA